MYVNSKKSSLYSTWYVNPSLRRVLQYLVSDFIVKQVGIDSFSATPRMADQVPVSGLHLL